MPESVDRSARRADYLGPKGPRGRPPPPGLSVCACESLDSLAEVRGALKKLKHDKNFLAKIFATRDRQLFPRDIITAVVPTKKGGDRPIAMLRRSLIFDKAKNRKALSIDFVWVMPEFRSCGIGRLLLQEGILVGRPKDVHLQVAGSEANTAAVGLYQSFGFAWDDDAPDKTEMILLAESVEAAASMSREQTAAPPAPAAAPAPLRVTAGLLVTADARVSLHLGVGWEADKASVRASPIAGTMPCARGAHDQAVRLSAG
eukprot:CAMPEP_0174705988 /NCGR_PEP_ID=MMETSP1094-20130205/9005_1 /TAXON_ID=156173 /ORGANISM="Chrysochromulina brevifilum, Strain UTEX LB 985" /LENGTH=258 /DNA_ID=CAMNT_0015904213 /DNA_START=53 /DNA_END=829 /DNA_ORIENTATION=+